MPISPAKFNQLVTIYETEIDSLIDNMGKACLLVFEPIVSGVVNGYDDRVRHGDIRKPSFATSALVPAPSVTDNTTTIIALIEYNPKDFNSFGTNVDKSTGIVQIKTYLTDVPNILKAKYMIPSYAVSNTIYSKYKLIRDPIPQGLKRNRYAVSYWERI